MMHPFLCVRCNHISNSVGGLHCPRCDGDGTGTVITANSYSAIPESADASLVYYVTVEDASTQVSEEDLLPLEPTREASTQTSDDDLLFDGSHGFENCLESDGPSQNQASYDFDHYTIVNQNGITHANTNEGEFQNQSYDECSPATILAVTDFKPSTSKQSCVSEQSSLGENESRTDEQFLTRRGPKEPLEGGITSVSFTNSDSLTLESKYPDENLLPDSPDKFEDRQDKDSIPPPFSSCPRGISSVNKCFQENSVTANSMSKKKPQTSIKLSHRRCGKCKRFFYKEWTFYAHFCDPRNTYKCGECDEVFETISRLLLHRMLHTGEKPFKCTQCDYATSRPNYLKKHMKIHSNIPKSFCPISHLLKKQLMNLTKV